MVFIAYFLALIVGIILGLLGSGGSILTVPILVYIMDINPVSVTILFIICCWSVCSSRCSKVFKMGNQL